MNFTFRPATLSDARFIAEGFYMAIPTGRWKYEGRGYKKKKPFGF